MGEKRKKKWGKPKLIVIARSMPEEGVLVTCKYWGINGPNLAQHTCWGITPGCPDYCQAWVGS